MDLPTVLSSGVLAGLVAGLVTLRMSERKIAIENITQQRQIWREKIRRLANQIKNLIKMKRRISCMITILSYSFYSIQRIPMTNQSWTQFGK